MCFMYHAVIAIKHPWLGIKSTCSEAYPSGSRQEVSNFTNLGKHSKCIVAKVDYKSVHDPLHK
jgi:hypothetical protein